MVKTQHFHCCGLGISPWLDNKDPISLVAKKKECLKCVYAYLRQVCVYTGIIIGMAKIFV